MVNLSQLFKNAEFGDYRVISEIYNDRHKATDKATISSSYVGKLIRKDRIVSPGTAAEEVIEIAQKYLESKKQMKLQLIAA
jgi:hypothetical protein